MTTETTTTTHENATRREAAAFLRVKPQTLRDWAARKIGPPLVTINCRVVLYPWAGLRAFVATDHPFPTGA